MRGQAPINSSWRRSRKLLAIIGHQSSGYHGLSDILDQELRERILAEITPTEDELTKQRRIIESLTTALEERAETLDVEYSFIEPHGSTGRKQTQLRGAADIDLFVALKPQCFHSVLELPPEKRDRRLSAELERFVDDWFRPAAESTGAENIKKTYSQHPYLSLMMEGLEADIVTCFDLPADYLQAKGPITAVDRTIHHTRCVSKRLDDRLRADVRLLKSFIRAGHAYGDRCAVGRMGLTGYCLELMVIWGEGLDGAVRAMQCLRENPLDPRDRTLAQLKNTPEFRNDYVFVIDPVDTDRNVASSFSRRSVDWTISRVHELLDAAHSKDSDAVFGLFIEEPISTAPLPPELQEHFVGIEFESVGSEHYTILRDKLYSQANRISERISRERTGEKRFGDCIFELYFETPRYALGFLLERPSVKKEYPRRGPPLRMKNAAEQFKAQHPNAYERDGYLWITETRAWTSARKMVKDLITKERLENLEILQETGELTRKVANILREAVLRVEEIQLTG
ncbi:hypothetical protein EU538_00390 [Candidatus Thorarchaeota archaeon]|nr:MAG: hypothetical protein EU538_00390 [Candidatus Thorarchaeota archaeon]